MHILRAPGCPTQEERDRHECTHMPHRAWCPVCIEAKGREDPHRQHRESVMREEPTLLVCSSRRLGRQLKMTIMLRPLS